MTRREYRSTGEDVIIAQAINAYEYFCPSGVVDRIRKQAEEAIADKNWLL